MLQGLTSLVAVEDGERAPLELTEVGLGRWENKQTSIKKTFIWCEAIMS